MKSENQLYPERIREKNQFHACKSSFLVIFLWNVQEKDFFLKKKENGPKPRETNLPLAINLIFTVHFVLSGDPFTQFKSTSM